MIDKLLDFLENLYGKHILLCVGLFFLLLAVLFYLGATVNEDFIVYPAIAIGGIAIIIAFVVLGYMAILWIPLVAVPALIPLWLILMLVEASPLVTAGLLAAIGIFFVGGDIYENRTRD